jgi:3-oxoacyl-[acyl-carrier protein] reductase
MMSNGSSAPGAVVTGSSRGIGAAVAERLAAAGYGVCINYVRGADRAADLVRRIESVGGRAFAFCADVASAVDAARLVEATAERYDGIRILVNNAGFSHHATVDELTQEDWDRALSVNLSAALHTVQAALPHLRTQPWGRVINVSSLRANTGSAHGLHYAAAKAGLLGLTRSLALALAPRITANAICPGYTRTDMTAKALAAQEGEIVARIPAGRVAEPEEIAALVGFLASPEAAYITGQTVSINGGLDMR